MIYLLTTIVFMLGVLLHVMIKVTSYKKAFPALSFGQIWGVFFKEEWDSLLVSLVILCVVEISITIINYVGVMIPEWLNWGIYIIALLMGYQGQRIAYKFLNTAIDALEKKAEGIHKINKP